MKSDKRLMNRRVRRGFRVRVLANETVATEDLDAVVGDPHRLLGRVLTREMRLLRRFRMALAYVAARLPCHPAHRFDLDVHLSQPECDRLLLGDRLVERDAVLGVGDAELEDATAGTDEDRGVCRPRRVENRADVSTFCAAELRLGSNIYPLQFE